MSGVTRAVRHRAATTSVLLAVKRPPGHFPTRARAGIATESIPSGISPVYFAHWPHVNGQTAEAWSPPSAPGTPSEQAAPGYDKDGGEGRSTPLKSSAPQRGH